MRKKILVVEDDIDLLRALTIRLHASGYQVVTAEDGKGAVDAARKEKPDLVLLDLSLPAGNGFAVLGQFNNLSGLYKTPVVVLTGRDPRVAEPTARGYGISAFLRKPVDNDVLLATIAEALTRGYRTAPSLQ
jgi:DNA-binding response OmpR family regulator